MGTWSGGSADLKTDPLKLAEALIFDTYGDRVSVANKKKVLRKFGESNQVQTTATTLMGNLSGTYNETYVERNLITHIASSSGSDTSIIKIEGHTCGADVSVSGITQTAGAATCTTGSAHGFIVGEWVNVVGADQAGYNGTFSTIYPHPSTTSFRSNVDITTVSPATGTITFTNLRIPADIIQAIAMMTTMMIANAGDCSDDCGDVPCGAEKLIKKYKPIFLGISGGRCC